MSAEPKKAPKTGDNKAAAPKVRPSVAAVFGWMPLPTVLYNHAGDLITSTSTANFLMTSSRDGMPRLFAQDGTDLWTIIAARSDKEQPFFDVRIRLRTAEGESADTTLAVVPLRGPGGVLGGAIVQILMVPGESLRAAGPVAHQGTQADFLGLVRSVGELTGAARAYVVEVDRAFGPDARVLASWGDDGSTLSTEPFSLRGTPSDSFAGRRLVCVPSKLASAYPDDQTIVDEGYEAYVGVALSDPDGEQVGILAGLWREPLEDPASVCAAFTVIATQVARSLEGATSERELHESEQRYSSVFEGSAMPIMLIEPETTQVVDANPAACAFYGYSRDEFMTMSILQVDAAGAEHLQAELRRAIGGAREMFASRQLLSGGRVRDVEVNIGPISVGGRQLLYAMINDVTERKRMEAELESNRRNLEHTVGQRTEDLLRANAELQQASVARDMVFVNLAQDMRTSLQTITGFSDLLLGGKSGELSEEQRRQIGMIQQAARRLTAFANTLIETHRAEEGEVTFEPEGFDLVDLVESVLFGLASFGEEKGLYLGFSAAERPLEVNTDRYKLQQILLNLLSNAIRYTHRGGVNVNVTRGEDGYDTISVADTGPGLRSDELSTLFDGPEVHNSAAGIGLPASQRLARALGGEIEVQSELGHGSVFSLRVPSQGPSA